MDQDSGRDRDMLLTDAPVERRNEDALGRARFAELLAAQISASPGGMVFGLTGPWGSGKTSVANMVVEFLEEGASGDGDYDNSDPETGAEHQRPVVLRFNPGLFSGTEQLVEHFFEELAAQFMETGDSQLQRVGELLANYAPMLGSLRFLPIIGEAMGAAGGVGALVGRLLQRRKNTQPTSVHERREQIRSALDEQPRRIVVIIDDLDRLRPQEVRDMVKLVRLNADFPKTNYLLCYDRERVERALGATDIFSEEDSAVGEAALAEGRSYLEKIVQLSYEIPHLRESDLTNILAEGLTQRLGAAGGEEDTALDDERLNGLFHFVVRPLMESLRDVKRYLNVLPAAFDQTRGEVALEDVMALEAVRLQLPSIHALLPQAAEALTQDPPPLGHSAVPYRRAEEGYKATVEALLNAAAGGEAREIVRECILLLFPSAACHLGIPSREVHEPQRWRRERRVAHPEVLATYLYKQPPAGATSAAEVMRVVEAAGDRQQLSELVGNMDAEELESIVQRLQDYVEVLDEDAVGPTIEVFLSNLPRMREETTGLFDFGPDWEVYGLVRDLLQHVSWEEQRAQVVEEALHRVGNLGAQVELVEIAGHGSGSEEGLVSEEGGLELDEHALQLIEGTPLERLAGERKPTEILATALRFDERLGLQDPRGEAYVRQALDDDRVLLAVLKDCLGYKHTLGGGGFDRQEQVFQPGRLTSLIGEGLATNRVQEVARRVDAGELPLDVHSSEAQALHLAVENFGVRPDNASDADHGEESAGG